MYDVAVVGAGPAGSRVAERMTGLGYNVAVLERKNSLSEPVCCTGIVGRECITSFGIDEDLIYRWANGARVYSPSGELLKLWRPSPQAAILKRAEFNGFLAGRAQDSGASYSTSTQVRAVRIQDDRVTIEAYRGEDPLSIDARIVVIATGFGGGLVEGLGLGRIGDRVTGAQVEVDAPDIDEVEVYFGQDIAPGFFAWLVPTSPGKALAGLLSRRSPGKYLQKLLSSLEAEGKIYQNGAEALHWGIPLKPLPRTYDRRLVVVGTAAGHVKPITGGGVYFGLLGADIAAQHLHRALVADDPSARRLGGYQRDWKERLAHEIRMGYWVRKVYDHLRDGQIERIFKIVQSSGILEDLLKSDDLAFDWHGGVVSRVLNYRVFLKTISAMSLPSALMKRIPLWSGKKE